ncbi:TetR/AcrR family transcriptional regulator [Reichenbachiella versicolor]|uniref:TetR/AcrR family transcriptional regulator n=1 Tax=Reichenbachiella versicolor TaxID=1821036 RepID=UPI000D6EA600|nr:TetR/AcrR family transcriptional regulator [Reichenbachiella versicolor]
MGYKHNIDEILDIGYDVLRKNGYHNVGVNQILKEAGIPKGSFYNFFESKEDFAVKVVKRYGETNTEWMKAFFDNSELSPIESLQSFYKFMIDTNETDDYLSGCIVNNMSIEVGRINNIMASKANEQFISWLNILAQVISKGQNLKEITTKFNALEIAEYLHAGFYGTFSRMKVTRNRTYMDIWYNMSFEFIKN